MLNPEGLDAYRCAFGGRAPLVRDNLCLNAGYKQAGCTLCVDSCPVNAITLHAHRPQLDDSSCVHCGACLPACPTDVFIQASAPEDTLVQTAGRAGASSLAVVCPVHQKPTGSRAPAELAIRHRRCLAALSIADLLALSRDGARDIWLDDTPCEKCRISAAHGQIMVRVAEANALLAAVGTGLSIFPLTEHADQGAAEAHTLPLVDGMQPKVSRRGLFDALRTAAADRLPVEPSAATPPTPRQSGASAHLPQNVPPSRIELLEHVARLYANAASDSPSGEGPFAAVAVDPQLCSGCGLCARVCPTDALAFDAHDARFCLTFQAVACIECAICEIACPEEAVSLVRHSDVTAWLEPQPVELAAGKLAPCEQCGVPTAVHRAGETAVLCYVCRPSPGLIRAL